MPTEEIDLLIPELANDVLRVRRERVNARPAATRRRRITLRDYFAAQTLTGILPDDFTPEHLAETAYQIADAMIAERSKTK